MNFTAGMRVYFWDTKGTLIRGVVVTVATTGDHSKMVTIKVDGTNAQVTLPAEGVTKE
ncbi:hypothetical protein CYLTODRAFT_424822 [Cylindrobasidium torrendii FP15055 ss-10]|uniref:Hypervirulence associated protein TUDOR domain-containing protein n=1 Tax=Cylindrobasidium torrendii FP15055 ss-10 TaxID=1314674 RepID=A0A0D7B5U3_9AGAR|nr:hypothetical protein CYLTODRAFT_424822 [Cylindrobasidium torrendii FP15055 ss-10]